MIAMAMNSYRVGRPQALPENGRLRFAREKTHWTLTFEPKAAIVKQIQDEDPDWIPPPKGGVLLADGDSQTGWLHIFPLNTTALRDFPFSPKYRRPRCIRFEGMTDIEAKTTYDVLEILSRLPSGFVRSPHAGLGFDYELRAIPEALNDADIDLLIVRPGRRDGLPALDENRNLVLARVQFDEIRRAIRRVHDKALDIANEEKDRVAFNQLLSAVDPSAWPEKPPIYRKDGVVAMIGSRSGDELSKADQTALLKAARAAVRPLAKREPEAMLQLSRDIELVTLEQLVDEMKRRLARDTKEAPWQAFFEKNPFILRLAFGYPVLRWNEQVSVGGGRFNGTGEKIADVVLKAAATGNLALIEIKAPETPLFGKSPYRVGLWAPTEKFVGGVNQILDQRHKLQANLAQKKQESGIWDVEAYAVDCLLVVGRSPDDRDQKKSLELFRHDLKSVLIVTYDELLTKLENLLEFLKITPSADDKATP